MLLPYGHACLQPLSQTRKEEEHFPNWPLICKPLSGELVPHILPDFFLKPPSSFQPAFFGSAGMEKSRYGAACLSRVALLITLWGWDKMVGKAEQYRISVVKPSRRGVLSWDWPSDSGVLFSVSRRELPRVNSSIHEALRKGSGSQQPRLLWTPLVRFSAVP